MGAKKKATFVKDVSRFFTQTAALYALDPPLEIKRIGSISENYTDVITHVVVCTTIEANGSVTTMVLHADPTGYITSWSRLDPWTPGVASDEQALKRIGYKI